MEKLKSKSKSINLQEKRGLYFGIGLSLTMLFVVSAFEWKTYHEGPVVKLDAVDIMDEILAEIPPTIQKPPKPPKILAPKIIEVTPEEVIDDMPEFIIDSDEIEVELDNMVIEPPEEPVEKVFDFVEHSPKPIGGLKAFYKFIGKELKYPSQARRMNVEGKVFISFIVDKDGSLTNIDVIHGIGAGCDEETLRVLAMAPKWQPGKQRGKPVKVRMVIPITFRLN